jgi:hypothetical protein
LSLSNLTYSTPGESGKFRVKKTPATELLDILAEIREKFDPQDTDEDFLIERMAKARCRYNRPPRIRSLLSGARKTPENPGRQTHPIPHRR